MFEDYYVDGQLDDVNWRYMDQGTSPNYECRGCDYADKYGCAACSECSEYKD